jgi:ABC-type branched-subunit amino acid transport system ATPase component
MTNLSYDPDRTPGVKLEALMQADKLGMRPVSVICDEPKAGVGDAVGMQFTAFVQDIPRVGESITLQDAKVCDVVRVYHKVVMVEGLPTLFPTVCAVLRVPKQGPE